METIHLIRGLSDAYWIVKAEQIAAASGPDSIWKVLFHAATHIDNQIAELLAPEPETFGVVCDALEVCEDLGIAHVLQMSLPLTPEQVETVMERARKALAELANDGWGSEAQVTAENEFGNVVESLLTPERFAEWEAYCLHATSEEIISSGLQALGLEPIKVCEYCGANHLEDGAKCDACQRDPYRASH